MIGLFDSGIGGLTVVRELLGRAPDASFVYLGDTARTPYGNKSSETVVRYALEDAAFLMSQGATSIVIACNSASAVATDALRREYPNILIFEVIKPAVEAACRQGTKRVGVIGTRATIASGSYEKLLRERNVEVIAKACPLFVPLVEEGWLDEVETKRIAKHYLSSIRQADVDALILGCTHYPLLTPIIQRFMGKQVRLVDSGATVVDELLKNIQLEQSANQRYFLTDLSQRSEEIAKQWLGRPIRFEKASF
ncbi:MAG: glutamate racemase [Patescibacteria group bacterium]